MYDEPPFFCNTAINPLLDPSVYPYIMPYPIHVDSSGGFIPDSVAGMFYCFLISRIWLKRS
jgi:hypothetical protein